MYRGLLELRAAVYADLMVSVLVSLSLVGDSQNHVLRMIDARTDTITQSPAAFLVRVISRS